MYSPASEWDRITVTWVLELEGVVKTFRRSRVGGADVRAVDDVSFSIEAGETVALVGESGAGKSTTGRLALRLIEPDSGTIRFNGRELRAMRPRALRRVRAKARMIFQDPYSSLDPRMTIRRAVEEPLLLHTSLNRKDRSQYADELLARVGLRSEYGNRYPAELSGGQLQRAAIARAIGPGPELIVCDEPVAALDMSIRAQVVNLLCDLQVERKMAYLFVSHDLSLVRLIADRGSAVDGHMSGVRRVEHPGRRVAGGLTGRENVGTRLCPQSCICWLFRDGVGMYLRSTQRKNRDGSIVRYIQLAHNRRVDGVTQAEVLLNLGREDRPRP
jgi:oligopeptide transport system ATP-binding protein